jgi:hypothetical protein
MINRGIVMIGVSIGKTGHVLLIVLFSGLLDGIIGEYHRTLLCKEGPGVIARAGKPGNSVLRGQSCSCKGCLGNQVKAEGEGE